VHAVKAATPSAPKTKKVAAVILALDFIVM
jgi:hypothetical protein